MQRLSWIFDSNKLRIKLQIEARIRDRASMSRAARHRSLQAKAQRSATKTHGAHSSLTLHLNRLQLPPRLQINAF
jgi:hypothetical protein